MSLFFGAMELRPRTARRLPDESEILAHAHSRPRPADVLQEAARTGRPVVQPRCGVGGHEAMRALLRELDGTGAGILSITVDSYTRLGHFDRAEELLANDPGALNGYPLVAHGWRRGRELTETVGVPLEVRHGSPDPRDLFAVSLAAGVLSFEGGPVGYTLPYSKDVPLGTALAAWREVDEVCGVLAGNGIVVDREFFGTLTAVLMPPSTSIAVMLLEALAATREGVRCVSLAYPQGGEAHQDVAALRAIPALAARYLGPDVDVYPVLHQFMGVFPREASKADEIIVYGGLVGRLGGAAKIVTKTNREAWGIPGAGPNAAGIRLARLGASSLFDFVRLDDDRVAEERYWIEREVAELIGPVLDEPDLAGGIERAFVSGRLDVPFSASLHARSEVVPQRDPSGAIRYGRTGALPFSAATRRRNDARLGDRRTDDPHALNDFVIADIHYFREQAVGSHPVRHEQETRSL